MRLASLRCASVAPAPGPLTDVDEGSPPINLRAVKRPLTPSSEAV